MTGRDKARASGYIDAILGKPDRRAMEHPDNRFSYDAGRRDGERCKVQPS